MFALKVLKIASCGTILMVGTCPMKDYLHWHIVSAYSSVSLRYKSIMFFKIDFFLLIACFRNQSSGGTGVQTRTIKRQEDEHTWLAFREERTRSWRQIKTSKQKFTVYVSKSSFRYLTIVYCCLINKIRKGTKGVEPKDFGFFVM